jgi:prevent-host-death family protein
MTIGGNMINMSAGEFKAHCLQVMETVRKKHETIIITKRGVPVAKLVPFEEEPKSLFGFMKGALTIQEDITKPLEEPWDADA